MATQDLRPLPDVAPNSATRTSCPEASGPVERWRSAPPRAHLSRPETTIRFYQDVLGFPLVELFENRDYQGSSHFFFDIGHENMLAFFDFPGLGLEPVPEGLGGVQHFAISVEPEVFERMKGVLAAAGVKYIGPDRASTSRSTSRTPTASRSS